MKNRRKSPTTVHGTATLEMALGLPLLFGLLVTIYTIASAVLTRNDATFAARLKASSGHDEPWEDDPLYDVEELNLPNHEHLAKILGPTPPYSPLAGLPRASDSRDVHYVAPPWQGLIPAAEAHAATAGASWDFRQIPFPPEAEHPRLVMVDKVKYLADRQDFALDAFTALADLHGSAGAGFSSSGLAGGLGVLKDPLEGERASVGRRLKVVQERISTVQRKLADARNAVPPDRTQIRQLETELANLQSERRNLEHADRAFAKRSNDLTQSRTPNIKNPEL